MTWAERIPAAIEKAEGWLGTRAFRYHRSRGWVTITAILTAGEVALAKALWVLVHYDEVVSKNPHPALRAFVEKVEAL